MFEKEAEERFVKSYSEFCCNGKPLSPYGDLWQDGAEFGYNKMKEELEKENAYKRKSEAEWRLNDLYQRLLIDYANAENCSRKNFTRYRTMVDRCIKAKEIINKLIKLVEFLNEDNVKELIIAEAEQFLEEK